MYQFQKIAYFFGLPYDWFLEDGGSIPNVDDLAAKLGLSTETVEALLDMSKSENEGVLTAVDDAICAVIATVNSVYDNLLCMPDDAVEDDIE